MTREANSRSWASDRFERAGAMAWIVIAASTTILACLPSSTVAQCRGDCIEDGQVTVDEVITLVSLALAGNARNCPSGDVNADGVITVDEVITAVTDSLDGCYVWVECREPAAGGAGDGNGLIECPETTCILGRCCAPEDDSCLAPPDDLNDGVEEDYCDLDLADDARSARVEEDGRVRLRLPPAFNGCCVMTAQAFFADQTPAEITEEPYGGVGVVGCEGDVQARRFTPRGLVRGSDHVGILISPASEATVRLLRDRGLDNYNLDQINSLIDAVANANAEAIFAMMSREGAAVAALQTAAADPDVQAALATPTPLPSPTPAATSTATATQTPQLPTVRWVGSADSKWTNPENWDPNEVPGFDDTVEIVALESPVVFDGSSSEIRGLSVQGDLEISRGTFRITGPASIDGSLAMGCTATLTVSGSGASLEVAGPVTMDGAQVVAEGGGRVRLDELDEYANSRCIALQRDGGYGASAYTRSWRASSGGVIELPNLSVIDMNGYRYGFTTYGFQMTADSGGAILLDGLVAFTGTNGPKSVLVSSGGIIDLGEIPSFDGGGTVTLEVEGLGSLLDLVALKNLDGGAGGSVSVDGGASLRTPELESVDRMTISDASESFDFSTVTSFTNSSLSANRSLDLSSVEDISGSNLFVGGAGSIDLSGVEVMNCATLRVSGFGSVLSVPATSYQIGGCGEALFEATFGGRLDLSSLQNLLSSGGDTVDDVLEIRADSAGFVDLVGTLGIGATNGSVEISAQGSGTVDLGGAQCFGNVVLTEDGGTIVRGELCSQ